MKSVTILGGTGTLGRALVKDLMSFDKPPDITILSRDEHKQAAMAREFPKCRYVVGDIRDPSSLYDALFRRDVVFHVAALKHVDIMERNPAECLKTNLNGTIAAASASIYSGVKHFLFSSTDKAVDPINMYGFAKAAAEKYLYHLNKQQSVTKFGVYRWGNVIGSNGSVIPIFAKTLKEQRRAYVTDEMMTRFWIPIEWATKYMLSSFQYAYADRAMIPPTMKSASLPAVIEAIADVLDIGDYSLEVIGHRPGEKLHEVLFSQWSPDWLSSDKAARYTHDELVQMIRPLITKGNE